MLQRIYFLIIVKIIILQKNNYLFNHGLFKMGKAIYLYQHKL